MEIDIERLRRDLIDYYGTAMMCGFGMLSINVGFIERASDEALIQIAIKDGFDLNDYVISYGRSR